MFLLFLIIVVYDAGVYFLFSYLASVLKSADFFGDGQTKVFAITIASVASFFVWYFKLNQKLISFIPPKSYEEIRKKPLSLFLGGGNVYAVIEKKDILFLEKGKIVRRKYDEISEDISFLPEERNVPPYLVELKAKRSGFWKYFFMDRNKLRFFVPRSGIKKGEIKFVERYEFISEFSEKH